MEDVNTNKKWVIEAQKSIIAEDYPWYSVTISRMKFDSDLSPTHYSRWVVLTKKDIGYTKTIFCKRYDTILEAYIKFEMIVKACEEGQYHGCTHAEGEPID